MADTATVQMFCARDNQEQPFTVAIDGNGEFLATCNACAHFLKFPSNADLQALVITHNQENQPAVQAASDGSIIPTVEQQTQLDSLASIPVDQPAVPDVAHVDPVPFTQTPVVDPSLLG